MTQPDDPMATPDSDQPTATAPKKSKTWLVAAIIVLAVVALVVALCLTVFREAIFGHRDTPYCQTYIRVAGEMPDSTKRLATAQTEGDLPAVQSALTEMIGQFQDLQRDNPLVSTKSSLESAILYLSDLNEFAKADDPEGYNDYVTMNSGFFANALTTLNGETVTHCK